MQEEMNLLDIDESVLEVYPNYRKVRVSVFGAVRKMRE